METVAITVKINGSVVSLERMPTAGGKLKPEVGFTIGMGTRQLAIVKTVSDARTVGATIANAVYGMTGPKNLRRANCTNSDLHEIYSVVELVMGLG